MDLDGDGHRDVITGSWPGELYFFPGAESGGFSAAQKLKDKNGKEMNLGNASAVFAGDWDRDGDLDLVVGDIDGSVWFVANESGAKELTFGEAVKLEADGKAISVQHGDSGPVLADWDADGTLDLVVGSGDGGVHWYPNATRAGMPELGAARELVAGNRKPAEGEIICGRRTKPHVVDWNGDGRLDLLVGDFFMGPRKKMALSEEDELRKIGLEAEQQALIRVMQPASQEVMRSVVEDMGLAWPEQGGFGAVYKELSDEQKQDYSKRMQEAYAKHPLMSRIQARLQEVYKEMRPLQGLPQVHGHVWLFLRKAAVVADTAEPTER